MNFSNPLTNVAQY